MDLAERLGLLLVGACALVYVPPVIVLLAQLTEPRLPPHVQTLPDLSTCPEFAGTPIVAAWGGATCLDRSTPPASRLR